MSSPRREAKRPRLAAESSAGSSSSSRAKAPANPHAHEPIVEGEAARVHLRLSGKSAPLLTLLSVTGARVLLRVAYHRRWFGGRGMSNKKERFLDKLALLETILLQIQLLPAARATVELLRSRNSGGGEQLDL